MNSVSLSILALLTEDVLPRETIINRYGVYMHTWMLNVYDDGKGSYFRIYLCKKNGIWASVSQVSGKTWGYCSPLCRSDFIHTTLKDALLDAWKDFECVEFMFHEKPKFYAKARKAFEHFLMLSLEEQMSALVIRD